MPWVLCLIRRAGQSIPNRLDVKKDKGVKIYFDEARAIYTLV